jgi:hypothetical protein
MIPASALGCFTGSRPPPRPRCQLRNLRAPARLQAVALGRLGGLKGQEGVIDATHSLGRDDERAGIKRKKRVTMPLGKILLDSQRAGPNSN